MYTCTHEYTQIYRHKYMYIYIPHREKRASCHVDIQVYKHIHMYKYLYTCIYTHVNIAIYHKEKGEHAVKMRKVVMTIYKYIYI